MIYWDLFRARDVEGLSEGVSPEGLLSVEERAQLSRLVYPKRRSDWLMGRYAVKSLCLAWLAKQGRTLAPDQVSVLAAEDGSPHVFLADQELLPVTVSLSHSNGYASAALTPAPWAPIGLDLERCEDRSLAFLEDFFTQTEAEQVTDASLDDRAAVGTAIWTLKEAALKALRVGLNADTRSVEIRCCPVPSDTWQRVELTLALPGTPPLARGWVRRCGEFALAVAELGPSPSPWEQPSDQLRGSAPVVGVARLASAA